MMIMAAESTGSLDFLNVDLFFLTSFFYLSSGSLVAASDSSNPSVIQILIDLEAFLISSLIAIAAKMQATGANTSMSLIMTQEK